MNKKTYSFLSIAILLLASFIPFGNAIAKEEKTIEFPVQIYTLHGVKEIRKELPLNEAMKLKEMAYETGKAIEMLHDRNASFVERMKANDAINSFLYEMKKNGLLGGMSIKEAKELITGKYLQKQNIEMKKLNALAKFLQQNGWKVNAMCSCKIIAPAIRDIFPWNLPIDFLSGLLIKYGGPILTQIAFLIITLFWAIPDIIPHFTTIGYWELASYAPMHAHIWTDGLYGKVSITYAHLIKLITVGFTGIVIHPGYAIGFCLYIAMKRVK